MIYRKAVNRANLRVLITRESVLLFLHFSLRLYEKMNASLAIAIIIS